MLLQGKCSIIIKLMYYHSHIFHKIILVRKIHQKYFMKNMKLVILWINFIFPMTVIKALWAIWPLPFWWNLFCDFWCHLTAPWHFRLNVFVENVVRYWDPTRGKSPEMEVTRRIHWIVLTILSKPNTGHFGENETRNQAVFS